MAGSRLAAAAAVVALSFAFACSESPTEATLDGMAPLFKPGKGKGPPPPSPPPTLKAVLTSLDKGVISDGEALYDGDDVTARFRLIPQCDDGLNGRHMSLQNVDLPADVLGESWVQPSTCNGGPQGGWVFFRLPDLLDIPSTDLPCSGQPLELEDLEEDDGLCPFPKIPSFDFSVNKKNGRVKYSATGAFAPNAQYFVQDLTTGERFEFLFQDASVERLANGSLRFRATEAHLYVGHQFVCYGGDPANPKDIEQPDGTPICLDIELNVDITVTP